MRTRLTRLVAMAATVVMLSVMAASAAVAANETYTCVAITPGTTVGSGGISKEQAKEFKSTWKAQGFKVTCVKE
jgi:hypothetical protein